MNRKSAKFNIAVLTNLNATFATNKKGTKHLKICAIKCKICAIKCKICAIKCKICGYFVTKLCGQ